MQLTHVFDLPKHLKANFHLVTKWSCGLLGYAWDIHPVSTSRLYHFHKAVTTDSDRPEEINLTFHPKF